MPLSPLVDPTAASQFAVERQAPLGGFFALELPVAIPPERGLAAFWGVAGTRLAWTNATSALAALVAHLRPGSIWLPGYLCRWTLAAIPRESRRFFPLRDDLSPDTAALDGRLSPGDMVLAVDMFGRAPGAGWREFVAAHPGVTFVEDCAQALDTGVAPWGDWRLFSPRKLLGIPEGGLLASVSERAQAQAADLAGPVGQPDPAGVTERLAPMLARLEQPDENGLWHPMHQAAEARHAVNGRPMSLLARAFLAAQDPEPLSAARRRNYRHLATRLVDHAVLPDSDPGFAPFGFPVMLPPDRREMVRDRLHARRIFPAVHWDGIAAPPAFARDHARARGLLTLPCDHRYGLDQMERLAAAFIEALP